MTMQRSWTLRHLLQSVGVILTLSVSAQTAQVQIIHNSGDALLEAVVVYVNNELSVEDLGYRRATPFLDLPAGQPFSLSLASSSNPTEILGSFDVELEEGGRYVVVVNGVVNTVDYNPAYALSLDIQAAVRTAANQPSNTDILVMHGGTDAPAVDISGEVFPLGAEVINLVYGDFSGYLELPAVDQVIQLDRSGGPFIGAFAAPLASLDLQGQSIVVVASGFVDPSMNNDGPAFGLWVALADGGALVELPAVELNETARVQMIHNSADAALTEVDVYINGALAVNNLRFREATEFLSLPALQDLVVGFAPGTSTGPDDIVATLDLNLASGETYIAVANGIFSSSGYQPAVPFGVNVFAQGRMSASSTGNTDVLVIHGSTDAPVVDVAEVAVPAGTVVDDLAYGDFAGYLELATADYALQVQTADGTPVVTYSAPLATLGLDGAAITVVASGFLDPSNNSDGPAFGLWVALADGGALVELPLYSVDPIARVQVIHNSADAAAAEVDVYINGELALDDFAFRTATPFIELPSNVDIEVGIAPGSSTGVDDIIATFNYTLETGVDYIIVANGIVSGSGYDPAVPFDLNVFAQARVQASQSGNTDVLVVHGSTDAPIVDVAEVAVPAGTVVDDLAYGDFAGYLELGTADYALQVQTSNGTPVVTYGAPLATLGLDGAAITVVASGFLDPANNSNGPAFGLWVALADGGSLVELPIILNVGVEEGLKNTQVNTWPNPTADVLNVTVEGAANSRIEATVLDLTGRRVLDIPTSNLIAGENRLTVNVNTIPNGAYLLRLNDGASQRSIPFQVAR